MKKLTILLALGIALSSCGNSDGNNANPEPSPTVTAPPISNGACLKADPTTGDIVINEDNVVDCEKNHHAEILAVVEIPWHYFKSGAPNQAEYDHLAEALEGKKDSTYQLRFNTWASVACEGAFQEVSGMSAIEPNGTPAIRARIAPLAQASINTPLFDDFETWMDSPRLLCTNIFVDDADADYQHLRAVKGSTTAQFMTANESLDQRYCIDRDGNQVNCTQRHLEERLFTFSAATVLDEEALTRARFAQVNDIEDLKIGVLQQFADICQTSFDAIIGLDWDEQNLKAGAHFGSGWKSMTSVPRVVCTVEPIDANNFDLPPGSVFGAGDKIFELLPREFSQ